MVFTATPVDGSSTPIPMSSAVPDGTNTPLPVEGGPSKSTGGNNLVPVAVYLYDGYDVTLGTSTDANTINSVMGRLTKIRDDLDILAASITATVMQANNKQINGTTISVNQGTVDAGTQRVVQGGAATGTKSSVGGSVSSVTILAANTARKGAMIYNESTAILYLDLSGGTATNASYSVQIAAQGFFELPGATIYNGLITGIWSAANGNARVTEFS